MRSRPDGITVTPAEPAALPDVAALEAAVFGQDDAAGSERIARFHERYPDLLLVAPAPTACLPGTRSVVRAPTGVRSRLARRLGQLAHRASHHRRQGVADTLLAALMAALAARGLTGAMLYAQADNHGALTLYARHGFRPARDPHPAGEPRVTLRADLS